MRIIRMRIISIHQPDGAVMSHLHIRVMTRVGDAVALSVPRHHGFQTRAIRHAIACALLLALLTPLGAAAILQGRAVSKHVVLREQENFSDYRSASSEAGR